MKKTLIVIAAVIVLVIAGSAAAVYGYTKTDSFNSDRLPDNIIINNVNCSGLTYKEAKKKLTESWNSRKVVVVGSLDEEIATFTDFGCEYDLDKQLKSLKESNLIKSAINHYIKTPLSVSIAMKIKTPGEEFENEVKNADFLAGSGLTESEDAYVDLDDPDFNIVKEVYGTKPDSDKFFDDLLECIETGQIIMEYDTDNYLTTPEVKSDDPELLAYQEFCRKYLSQNITYEFGDEEYTLTARQLRKFYKDDLDGSIKKKAVTKFVKKLAAKYDTAGESITMKSFSGRKFKVNGGTYGWIISTDGEKKQLIKDLKSLKDVSREPVYSQKGEGEYSHKVGDTYIDVDLKNQHVYYFENGENKFESDCVSGNVSQGHDTPTGIYYINNMSRNVTLKGGGKKDSSTYYESHVGYWMSFIGSSVGLHDASWRSSFGGSIYKTAGSHGCVNLPTSKAPKLYKLISIGTPVVVHY